MAILLTTQFSYNKGTKTFAAEISDFNGTKLGDELILRNPSTGNQVGYFLAETHRDGEGDITHWEFWPQAISKARFPACTDTKVVLFND